MAELPDNTRESLSVRYNNLRTEAIKFVEEGAKSIHVYNVAMDALQDAVKKVAAVKNHGSGTKQGGTLSNGGSQESHANEENLTATYSSVVSTANLVILSCFHGLLFLCLPLYSGNLALY